MNAVLNDKTANAVALWAAAEQAGARIAPTWPLDQFIAVNPWWELKDQPFPEVAAKLSALAGIECLMPGAYYRACWERGEITIEDLQAAAQESGQKGSVNDWLGMLEKPETPEHWHTISDFLDQLGVQHHRMAWRDEISHQLSQFCADYQQQNLAAQGLGLYATWRQRLLSDKGVGLLMAEPKLHRSMALLPERAETLLCRAMSDLMLPEALVADYLHALLLDINGWAAWLAYQRWQARLQQDKVDQLPDLVAMRLAWDWLLWEHYRQHHPKSHAQLAHLWQRQQAALADLQTRHFEAQAVRWLWQRALELRYQKTLQQSLTVSKPESQPSARPLLQAVFCIDVRSEPLRRALEAQAPGIETLGFAGFFGLPIACQTENAAYCRPQLPGLLAPSMTLTMKSPAALGAGLGRSWQSAPAMFTLVEALGLGYAFKLLAKSFFPTANQPALGKVVDWRLKQQGRPITLAEQVTLARTILSAMGLRERFAASVLLVGHGSESCNNPHASGLDCGACGGQNGELNVRVLARLLNDDAVRQALATEGLVIPDDTLFIPALHNTTTDDVLLFDAAEPPLPANIQGYLNQASARTRSERAARWSLGVGRGELKTRARDWSQVRPEWGLANNAAFIVAPRARTRHSDLNGRCFLHDYDWHQDADFSLLELIMTAPMIVTQWINMQYYASVTEPLKYGSGNKVLHNVVGGHIGVFEGNGGDLRIGLPRQSVHDGQQWRHQPVRLSVYIDAPKTAIAAIAQRHEAVRQLVDHDWLYLFCIGDQGIERYYRKTWQPA